jgi:hypothetical protein
MRFGSRRCCSLPEGRIIETQKLKDPDSSSVQISFETKRSIADNSNGYHMMGSKSIS